MTDRRIHRPASSDWGHAPLPFRPSDHCPFASGAVALLAALRPLVLGGSDRQAVARRTLPFVANRSRRCRRAGHRFRRTHRSAVARFQQARLLHSRKGGPTTGAVASTAPTCPPLARSSARRDTRVETRIRAEACAGGTSGCVCPVSLEAPPCPLGTESGGVSRAGRWVSTGPPWRGPGTGPVVHLTRADWPRGIVRTSPSTPRWTHNC